MKTNPDDLAYPHHAVWDGDKTDIGWIDGGLTKIEYFAAMAMQGLICSSTDGNYDEDAVAESSTRMANALIEELNKGME